MAPPWVRLADRGRTLARGVRERRPWVDHLARAYGSYGQRRGDRLAAAVTFFAFLSFFPLLVLAFAVLGYLVRYVPDVQGRVSELIAANLPGLAGSLDLGRVAEARQKAGVFGLLGLLLAGLGWVAALREALRTMFGEPPTAPGNPVTSKLADASVLLLLGLAVLVSLAVSSLGSAATTFVLSLVGLDGSLLARWLLRVVALGLAVLADLGVFAVVFARLPGAGLPLRQVLRGALFAAVGFGLLKVVGALLVARTTANPVYASFAVVVGLLVWIDLVSRFTLFAAAWTATAGPVRREGGPLLDPGRPPGHLAPLPDRRRPSRGGDRPAAAAPGVWAALVAGVLLGARLATRRPARPERPAAGHRPG